MVRLMSNINYWSDSMYHFHYIYFIDYYISLFHLRLLLVHLNLFYFISFIVLQCISRFINYIASHFTLVTVHSNFYWSISYISFISYILLNYISGLHFIISHVYFHKSYISIIITAIHTHVFILFTLVSTIPGLSLLYRY